MRFRPHRGMLVDAMEECVELPDREALVAHLGVDPSSITIKSYSPRPDNRIGWAQTCIVLQDGFPIGFTDSLE